MINNRPVGFVTGMLLVFFVGSASLFAQESEYQSDLRPGLTVRSDNSLLADAARSGTSITIGASGEREEAAPDYTPKEEVVTVREGDTLWDICDRHFGDPYVWPRIWSYNTKITNPNWIYPGDVIWLTAVQPTDAVAVELPEEPEKQQQVLSRMPNAELVRNQGFIDKKALKRAGKIVGAHKNVQLLGQHDEAYVEFKEKEDKHKKKKKNKETKPMEIHVGDEFSLFKVVGPVKGGIDDPKSEIGKLVEIVGEVRVTQFNGENRIARVVIMEATKEIKRGTRVGLLDTRFKLVPTVTNTKDIEGRLVAILNPNSLAAAHQMVFVDRGTEHGVRDGNRFFAVQVRDRWRASRGEADDREGYPTEVMAELRVIEARPQTSTCWITSAIQELKVGQRVEMRKGY
jgi:hypothetical protein